jgi:hypothetical protein
MSRTGFLMVRDVLKRLEEETGEHQVIKLGRGAHRPLEGQETTGVLVKAEPSLVRLALRQVGRKGRHRFTETTMERAKNIRDSIYGIKWSVARQITLWPSVLVGAALASIFLGGS